MTHPLVRTVPSTRSSRAGVPSAPHPQGDVLYHALIGWYQATEATEATEAIASAAERRGR
ncbi:hypothetical protein STRIP9103_05505 [Streptomyces ipomoeae 91-03]|uniref:Uncharacterized protein n=1 Tax=Streptomyces ipomoeae 91-03 TaxID=698759 RepID=L1KYG7_9ACTN|nr:hypothetical protein STRIP9103_05505 [Streptomyces ipomoeae 91-03]